MNANVMNLPAGSILSRPKLGFWRHVGLLMPGGLVYDNTPETGERLTTFEDFAQSAEVTVVLQEPQDAWAAVARAYYELQRPRPYSAGNTCEHTLTRVLGEEPRSPQLLKTLAAGSIAALLFYGARRK